tara:strand:+ start:3497 stop:3949 length:453 start_codon:yes stop_codon:yes gene_type:complete
MINEEVFTKILSVDQIKINKPYFGSPMKKFINNIYGTFDIPKDSFYTSLFYLYQFYIKNKSNNELINIFFENTKSINLFIFTAIVLSLKNIYDEKINIKNMTDTLNINFNDFLRTELIIIKGLNWNLSYETEDYYKFKKYLEHYKDLNLP